MDIFKLPAILMENLKFRNLMTSVKIDIYILLNQLKGCLFILL